jgi:acetylornithine deacetylase
LAFVFFGIRALSIPLSFLLRALRHGSLVSAGNCRILKHPPGDVFMDALKYAADLVAFESTSVLSNVPVSDYVEGTLAELGFATERLEYDDGNGVRKASIVGKKGTGSGGMAYFGHTDVVPADPWFSSEHGPFQPTVVGSRLYGRGSSDMKGSIGCMLAAAARFDPSKLKRPVYITCTADEEIGYGGAAEVARRSQMYREMVAGKAYGIIGEPTMLNVVYAHKGTYGFRATSRGRAAHSSTSAGINANLKMIPFLAVMKQIHDETMADPAWQNSEFDPPTISWNIGINDHTRAVNITAPQSICTVYFRPMPGQNPEVLLDRARKAAEECGLEFEVTFRGKPLYVDPKSTFVRECLELADRSEPRTVAFGTDGAMFGEMKNLVLLGPGNIVQGHTHDEWIELDQLERGTDLYTRAIERWCC